jgi:tRNA(Ile)-lysidine synthase
MENPKNRSVVERFNQEIKKWQLFTPGDILLLAVSGGKDSVVLCELCHQSGHQFIIAHCNFQLRDQESERDETFVRKLGEKYKVNVIVKNFDTTAYANNERKSIQVAARDLRYAWFRELIEVEKIASYVLTAHHADDNAETIVMNFFRGTGLKGLTGMPNKADYLRRPLLHFTHAEINEFRELYQLDFVEDSSNQSNKYVRNLFRNEILPLVEKVYPQVKENLQDNIVRFTAIEELYRVAVEEMKKKLLRRVDNDIHIPIKQLMQFPNRALIYDIFSDYGFTEGQVDEVLKLAESESGKFLEAPAGRYRIIKHRHWFIISPVKGAEANVIVIEEKDQQVAFGSASLEKSVVDTPSVKPGVNQACLDASVIEFPLLLRKWKQGDYFYPFGMKKKKKLARFFIDQKLSKIDKEKVWVLEMNKKIVWVVGMRIDERFKVTPSTKKTLEFTIVN